MAKRKVTKMPIKTNDDIIKEVLDILSKPGRKEELEKEYKEAEKITHKLAKNRMITPEMLQKEVNLKVINR